MALQAHFLRPGLPSPVFVPFLDQVEHSRPHSLLCCALSLELIDILQQPLPHPHERRASVPHCCLLAFSELVRPNRLVLALEDIRRSLAFAFACMRGAKTRRLASPPTRARHQRGVVIVCPHQTRPSWAHGAHGGEDGDCLMRRPRHTGAGGRDACRSQLPAGPGLRNLTTITPDPTLPRSFPPPSQSADNVRTTSGRLARFRHGVRTNPLRTVIGQSS